MIGKIRREMSWSGWDSLHHPLPGPGLASPLRPASVEGVKIVTIEEAEKLVEAGATFVDVRTPEEFADGHVPGAINVPVSLAAGGGMAPNAEFVSLMTALFDKAAPLVVSCKAGGRSARAAAQLDQAGFQRVSDMSVGFEGNRDPFGRAQPGWRQEGRDIETDATVEQTYAGVRRRVATKS
jgi:rhodanese-related sulfurtransferase